ncbi:hypothetical protein HDU96_002398 [Phlyctochytrium bullatum]|nr:hypothetical protein HDU96_002398 [Phlyctochytrium bullatum]
MQISPRSPNIVSIRQLELGTGGGGWSDPIAGVGVAKITSNLTHSDWFKQYLPEEYENGTLTKETANWNEDIYGNFTVGFCPPGTSFEPRAIYNSRWAVVTFGLATAILEIWAAGMVAIFARKLLEIIIPFASLILSAIRWGLRFRDFQTGWADKRCYEYRQGAPKVLKERPARTWCGYISMQIPSMCKLVITLFFAITVFSARKESRIFVNLDNGVEKTIGLQLEYQKQEYFCSKWAK